MGKRPGFTRIELIAVIGIVFILLACAGFLVPGDFVLNLACGWVFYLYRVLPQVHVRISGVLTAILCLSVLAIGLHGFLHWFARQRSASASKIDAISLTWPARRTTAILGLIVLMFVAGISAVGISHQAAWLLTSPEPIVEGGIRQVAAQAQSQNNLKNMAVAMHVIYDNEKKMPPAAIHDQHGKPLLSWRVRILPHLEQGDLYKEFHLDEPWDSPHNLRLLPRMPPTYALPGAQNVKSYKTPYQVFVGKGAAFEGKRGLRLRGDFPDGPSNTILIAEAAELVPWTKPADLRFDQRPMMPVLHRWSTSKTCLVALADGSVRAIPQSMKESTLRAAITRNGDETLGPDW